MGASNGDQRPPFAVGMELASQIMSISLMMALPAGAGYWGDSKFGTSPWLLSIGAVLGLLIGMMQLFRGMGRDKTTTSNDRRTRKTPP